MEFQKLRFNILTANLNIMEDDASSWVRLYTEV